MRRALIRRRLAAREWGRGPRKRILKPPFCAANRRGRPCGWRANRSPVRRRRTPLIGQRRSLGGECSAGGGR